VEKRIADADPNLDLSTQICWGVDKALSIYHHKCENLRTQFSLHC
jgi:hypothetical protein